AGRDDDLGRLDRDAVALAVMPGDRLAQWRDAECVGIADAVLGQGLPRRVEHRRRRRGAGLTDFEMDDRLALRLALVGGAQHAHGDKGRDQPRSEEHTSELQSPYDLVCRLLLEKKKHTS